MGLKVDNDNTIMYSKLRKQTVTNTVNDNNDSIFNFNNIKKHKTELAIACGIATVGLIGLSLLTKKRLLSNKTISLKNEFLKLDLNGFINEKNFIGEGAEGTVYKIANSNYVIKVPHLQSKFPVIRGKEVDISKLDFNISKQDRINHVVAHCGKATIMNYIGGEPSLYAPADVVCKLTSKNIKEFFLDIIYANKHKMRLDWPTGGNCNISSVDGKLTLFDLYPGKGYHRHLLTIFSTLVAENPHLNRIQQNSILKKGAICLLELFKDKKINIRRYRNFLDSELDDCQALKSPEFVKQLKEILCQYKNSKININDCIEKLKKLDPNV